MELLRCTDLKKVYGKGDTAVCALDGIDLTVERGTFVAVVGASGSGKSTLLHLLAGVDRPTAGQVLMDGVEVGSLDPTQAALFRRRKVGLIYQFFNLIPTLSVEKNIALPLLLDKRKPDPVFLASLLRTLGLEEKRHALPVQLSGGQQQRVSIGRALIHHPAILLADEPTGNLDSRNTQEIMTLLRMSNKQRNQTCIVITHDENIALQADRIIAIEDGRISSDQVIRQ